jgi:Ca2+-binding EF-hand superfamily protein
MNALPLALFLLAASPQEAPKAADDDAEQAPLELPLEKVPIEELFGEERAEAEALLHARLEEEYFLATDGNGNGWISFREGVANLRMDRPEYFRFDTNADGRIAREEFAVRYRHAVESVGSFRPPTSRKQLFETPEDSPLTYDFNGTGALEVGEVRAFLADKGITVPIEPLLEMLDRNASGALEASEFLDIIATLTPLLPVVEGPTLPEIPSGTGLPFGPAGAPAVPPRTADELFGVRVPRPQTLGNTPMPDHIVGPVSHFRRLDYDGDGSIEESDLLDLLRPAHSSVRASAVLAALDRDGDGRLSKAELAACLGAGQR